MGEAIQQQHQSLFKVNERVHRRGGERRDRGEGEERGEDGEEGRREEVQ